VLAEHLARCWPACCAALPAARLLRAELPAAPLHAALLATARLPPAPRVAARRRQLRTRLPLLPTASQGRRRAHSVLRNQADGGADSSDSRARASRCSGAHGLRTSTPRLLPLPAAPPPLALLLGRLLRLAGLVGGLLRCARLRCMPAHVAHAPLSCTLTALRAAGLRP